MTNVSFAARDSRTGVVFGATVLRAAVTLLSLCALAATFMLASCSSDGEGNAADGSASPMPADATEAATTLEPGVLTVASALNHEPYEQATSTSQNGFTIDLLNLLGEKAGLSVKFGKAVNHKDEDQNITEGTSADVAAKVAEGSADLGASTMRRDEPLEGVAFTDKYLVANLVVVTKMNTGHNEMTSLEGDGVKVAVSGDDAAAWAAENLPNAEVAVVSNDIDALIEVNSELAQAAVVDEPLYRRYIKVKEPHLQALETTPLMREYGFAVAADNTALLAAMNEALATAQADGSYDELYEKWFGDAPEAGTATRPAPEAVQDSTGA